MLVGPWCVVGSGPECADQEADCIAEGMAKSQLSQARMCMHAHTYRHTYTHTHSHAHSHTHTHMHILTHLKIKQMNRWVGEDTINKHSQDSR